MLRIWFVDDQHDNLSCWLSSFSPALRQNHEFRCFDSVAGLFHVLDTGQWPDVLFIDFYIGPRYGHEVLAYFAQTPVRPVLIAHSSMAKANRAMLDLGADLALEKVPGQSATASITALIRSEADLLRLARR